MQEKENFFRKASMLSPSYDVFFYVTYAFVKPSVTARVGTLRPPGVTVYSIPRYFFRGWYNIYTVEPL